ncbi:MAG: hypothetical protein NC231_05885 [Bacillus sp. (in: Bacteria)]|nr:hypothetical protein [Bacillus sp. (in: firmicutes)]MCM1427795.1 hypothetical protein [Eubacterium sp.]
MLIAGSGIKNGTSAAQYWTGEDVVFKSYSYKNGKGEETVYHLKDCLQLSLDSYTIPVGSENYEAIKGKLKSQAADYMKIPDNKLFYETNDIMTDFYNGKLERDEVKNIFKEYFYHSGGRSFATDRLAGLYEHFSRANTRCAYTKNKEEGKELLESKGLNWRGSYYYNADWYWACEDMQNLFKETADELADEFDVEHVDFEAVEKNTKYKLDGGITYNGVWNSTEWQISAVEKSNINNYLNMKEAPPKGFLYYSASFSDSTGWGSGKVEFVRMGK